MATALSALIQALSEETRDYRSLLASSNGTTTTIIDTSLANLPGGGDDDFCEDWYIKITEAGHNSVGQIRRISSYAQSSNTITWLETIPTLLSSAEAYELHRYDPADKALALNQAIEKVIDDFYLPIRDETLVVDQRLAEWDFENDSGGSPRFTGWTEVGSPTVTKETSIIFHGTGSAKVVASGADGQLTQTRNQDVHEITNKQVTFRAWAFATAADKVRIRLDWDGSNFDNSIFHSGEDQWEQLTVTAQVPSTATQVKYICEVVDGSTGYFDAAYAYDVPIHRYTLPTAFVYSHITQQVDESLPGGPFIGFGRGWLPVPGRILRVEGKTLLSTMATDAGTTELNAPQTRALAIYAAGLLYRMQVEDGASRETERFEKLAQAKFDEYASLMQRPGMRMKRLGRTSMRDTAHIERDGTNNYLVFDRLGRTAGPLAGNVRL